MNRFNLRTISLIILILSKQSICAQSNYQAQMDSIFNQVLTF